MKKIAYILIFSVVICGFGLYYYNENIKTVSLSTSYPPEYEKEIFDDLSESEIYDVLFEISKNPTENFKKSLEDEYREKGHNVNFSKIVIEKFTKRDLKEQERIKDKKDK